jgi:integrase
MPRIKASTGPIGSGWVEEITTESGTRFVARWKAYEADADSPDGRKRVSCGPYELGPKVKRGDGLKTLNEAKKSWDKIAHSIMGRTQEIPLALKAQKTFRWFAQEDIDGFMQRRVVRWGVNMKKWYDYLMSKHILPKFGEVKLNEMREQDMQAFLNDLADRKYSRSVVKNSRLYLMAIMEEARACGILTVSPAARLTIPQNTRKVRRSWLSIAEYQAAIEATANPRDRLMMKILYLGGLRRGELFALQWQDFDAQTATLNLERQVLANGTLAPLKCRDGEKPDPVAIPRSLADELVAWKQWCPETKPESWIFQGVKGGHVNPGHWRRTVLLPVGEKVGIDKLNYHMFRRGLATEAHRAGVPDKGIQMQLRHGEVRTTQDLYQQGTTEGQRDAAETMGKLVEMPKSA